jgi:hypothetical protein
MLFLRTESCGGSNLISVYGNGKTPSPPPVTNPGPPGFSSQGCWVDSGNPRTLNVAPAIPGGANALTVGLCTSACTGYNYAGVEYSGECYCGNSILGTASKVNDGCTMVSTLKDMDEFSLTNRRFVTEI